MVRQIRFVSVLVIVVSVFAATSEAAAEATSSSARNHARNSLDLSSSSSSQHNGTASSKQHNDISVGDFDTSDAGSFGGQKERSHNIATTTSSPQSTDEPEAGISLSIDELLAAAATPAWLSQSPRVGALTSFLHTTPQRGDGLVDGVVVRIAPRFVVTATELLSARGLERLHKDTVGERVVVFNGDAVRVTSVKFESEYYANSSYSLVVLELEREPKESAAPLVSIVTSKPSKGFEFELLTTVEFASVFDSQALFVEGIHGLAVEEDALVTQSNLTFFMEPMCGFNMPATRASTRVTQMCVAKVRPSTRQHAAHDSTTYSTNANTRDLSASHDERHSSRSSHRDRHAPNADVDASHSGGDQVAAHGPHDQRTSAAVLLYDNELVGLSIPTATPRGRWARGSRHMASDRETSPQGFVRLAAHVHRVFLDFATHQTTLFIDDDVFSKRAKYPSYLATFVDADDHKLPCQGVLIAPKYVLTTASCVEQIESLLRGVMFYDADASHPHETVSILHDRIAKHPRYTAGDATFDTAVIELEKELSLTQVAPIKLDDGSATANASFARIQVSADDQCVVSATSWNTNAHRNTHKNHSNDDNDNSDDDGDETSGCRNAWGTKYKASEAICGVPMAANARTPFFVKNFVGDPSIVAMEEPSSLMTTTATLGGAALIKLCEFSGVALVGLSVAPSTTSSHSGRRGLKNSATEREEVYVRVSNSATFINAYVAGISWSASMATTMTLSVPEDDPQLPTNLQFIVGLRSTKDGQNYCGGSLIAPSFVLTAAHCVVDGPASYVSIGAYESSGIEAEVIAIRKSSTQIHTLYGSPHKFSYDVAILELEFSSAVAPVRLDDTPDFVRRETATMFGYGMQSATSGLSATLRAVKMPLWSQAACQKVYGSDVDGSMLCAGGEKGKDACTGDSGSPLVELRKGENVLVGVVSAGASCGLENVPGVYARVSSVRSFVQSRAVGASLTKEGTSTSSPGGSSAVTTTIPSTPSSTTTPVPTKSSGSAEFVAMKAREANGTSTSSTPSTASNEQATLKSLESGAYNMASLPLSGLSPLARSSLMSFLLGSESEHLLSSATIDALNDPDNLLRFYSTHDLARLLRIVEHHNMTALSVRRDRFGRWKNTTTQPTGVAYCAQPTA